MMIGKRQETKYMIRKQVVSRCVVR